MLQNAYLLAKIGADTAENERNFAENSPKIANYPTGQGRGRTLRVRDRKGTPATRPFRVRDRKGTPATPAYTSASGFFQTSEAPLRFANL